MTGADIRDIAGPVPIPDLWLAAGLTAAGVALVVAALLAARTWRARRSRAETPEARALARIAQARSLIETSCVREYGVAVSAAIRLFIEERFGERAAHRTTEEFLRDLTLAEAPPLAVGNVSQSPSLVGASSLAARRPLLERFLRHCDLAKFAHFALTTEEMEALHESALRFVRDVQEAGPAAR